TRSSATFATGCGKSGAFSNISWARRTGLPQCDSRHRLRAPRCQHNAPMEAALDTQDTFIDPHCFEQIVARSAEGILLLDATDPDLPVIYVNSAFESLTGFRARDVVGKRWHVLERDRNEHRGVDELLSAVERSEPIEVELPDRRKDGTVWICSIGFSKLADSRGEVRYYLIQQRPSPRRLGL